MTYQLRAVEVLEPGIYMARFEDSDAATPVIVRCTVISHEGISGVQPEPDIFMSGKASARAVSAVVIAFDHAVRDGDPSWKA